MPGGATRARAGAHKPVSHARPAAATKRRAAPGGAADGSPKRARERVDAAARSARTASAAYARIRDAQGAAAAQVEGVRTAVLDAEEEAAEAHESVDYLRRLVESRNDLLQQARSGLALKRREMFRLQQRLQHALRAVDAPTIASGLDGAQLASLSWAPGGLLAVHNPPAEEEAAMAHVLHSIAGSIAARGGVAPVTIVQVAAAGRLERLQRRLEAAEAEDQSSPTESSTVRAVRLARQLCDTRGVLDCASSCRNAFRVVGDDLFLLSRAELPERPYLPLRGPVASTEAAAQGVELRLGSAAGDGADGAAALSRLARWLLPPGHRSPVSAWDCDRPPLLWQSESERGSAGGRAWRGVCSAASLAFAHESSAGSDVSRAFGLPGERTVLTGFPTQAGETSGGGEEPGVGGGAALVASATETAPRGGELTTLTSQMRMPSRPFDVSASPLLAFRSFRAHPHFRKHLGLPLASLTYSHSLNPFQYLCRYELRGGCRDPACVLQHARQFALGPAQLAMDLARYGQRLAHAEQLPLCAAVVRGQGAGVAPEAVADELFAVAGAGGADGIAALLCSGQPRELTADAAYGGPSALERAGELAGDDCTFALWKVAHRFRRLPAAERRRRHRDPLRSLGVSASVPMSVAAVARRFDGGARARARLLPSERSDVLAAASTPAARATGRSGAGADGADDGAQGDDDADDEDEGGGEGGVSGDVDGPEPWSAFVPLSSTPPGSRGSEEESMDGTGSSSGDSEDDESTASLASDNSASGESDSDTNSEVGDADARYFADARRGHGETEGERASPAGQNMPQSGLPDIVGALREVDAFPRPLSADEWAWLALLAVRGCDGSSAFSARELVQVSESTVAAALVLCERGFGGEEESAESVAACRARALSLVTRGLAQPGNESSKALWLLKLHLEGLASPDDSAARSHHAAAVAALPADPDMRVLQLRAALTTGSGVDEVERLALDGVVAIVSAALPASTEAQRLPETTSWKVVELLLIPAAARIQGGEQSMAVMWLEQLIVPHVAATADDAISGRIRAQCGGAVVTAVLDEAAAARLWQTLLLLSIGAGAASRVAEEILSAPVGCGLAELDSALLFAATLPPSVASATSPAWSCRALGSAADAMEYLGVPLLLTDEEGLALPATGVAAEASAARLCAGTAVLTHCVSLLRHLVGAGTAESLLARYEDACLRVPEEDWMDTVARFRGWGGARWIKGVGLSSVVHVRASIAAQNADRGVVGVSHVFQAASSPYSEVAERVLRGEARVDHAELVYVAASLMIRGGGEEAAAPLVAQFVASVRRHVGAGSGCDGGDADLRHWIRTQFCGEVPSWCMLSPTEPSPDAVYIMLLFAVHEQLADGVVAANRALRRAVAMAAAASLPDSDVERLCVARLQLHAAAGISKGRWRQLLRNVFQEAAAQRSVAMAPASHAGLSTAGDVERAVEQLLSPSGTSGLAIGSKLLEAAVSLSVSVLSCLHFAAVPALAPCPSLTLCAPSTRLQRSPS